ncbi:hypothetical protein QYE76_033844 [Lolium multiflorum]|uniref:Retrotransposon gag domain-containing protein n=1 Tax=Lolium multiflorum TaxID=4521 RepID=A0AAD8QWH2_LOLMU|nr:hypothetical protein QYE76_033844 [Lolium multiflorum]
MLGPMEMPYLLCRKLIHDEDIPTSLLPPSLPTEDEPAVKLKSNEVRIGPITRARAKLLKQQVSRGDEHRTRRGAKLDMKMDVKMAVKGHGAGHEDISWTREGGAGGMRERRRRSPGRSEPVRPPPDRPAGSWPATGRKPDVNRRNDNKIVNQENKNSADIITWREYEALRNEMRREFRTNDDELKSTVDEIKQTLDATNVTVTGLSDQMTDIQRNIADMRLAIENLTVQQQQQEDDEDPELEDDAHNARGAPRGHRPRGWVPLGRNGRGQDEEDGLGKPKFSIPKFEGGADVEEYLTWELKIEKLWSLHPHYSEDRKIKLASSEFDGYALRWWDSLVRNRDEDGAQPIRTWHAMKEVMTYRFVPTNYMRNIFDKLTLLRQGVKTVDEYYMEMEMLMQRGRVRESLEMTMQRFLNGLKYDVKGIVRHYTYTNMNQLLHHAREAESQLAEEAKVSRGDEHRTRRGAAGHEDGRQDGREADMELDMKISHGRAREEREACARGEEEVQAGPEPGAQTGQPGPGPVDRSQTGRQPEEALVPDGNRNFAVLVHSPLDRPPTGQPVHGPLTDHNRTGRSTARSTPRPDMSESVSTDLFGSGHPLSSSTLLLLAARLPARPSPRPARRRLFLAARPVRPPSTARPPPPSGLLRSAVDPVPPGRPAALPPSLSRRAPAAAPGSLR